MRLVIEALLDWLGGGRVVPAGLGFEPIGRIRLAPRSLPADRLSNFFVSTWTKDLTFERRARSSGSASIGEFFASRAPRINFVLGLSEILFAATAPKPAVPPVINCFH